MKEKLANGAMFNKFITSYGDRPNDFEATSGCEYCDLSDLLITLFATSYFLRVVHRLTDRV